jgi:predicted AlkP superfamily phosphohydrolase/phosphomutase
MEKKKWDIFMGVFIGTDRIQHYLWKYIHPAKKESLTQREKNYVSMVYEYFKQLDEFIGELMKRMDENTNLIIISDHGFGPLYHKMYINKWLESMGYLKVLPQKARIVSAKKHLFHVMRTIVRSIDPLKVRKTLGIRLKRTERMGAYEFLNCIDWSKTRAYSASNTEQGIYLNLKGREPEGIVRQDGEYNTLRDEVIQALRDLKDPHTGERLVTEVYKREELYEGPFVANAPDIILFLKGGEYLLDVQLNDELFTEANWQTGSGTHRGDGILIGYGPNIVKGLTVKGACIVDLAPTILYSQNLPIPEYMDGRPLLNIFEKDFRRVYPVSYTKKGDSPSTKKETGPVLTDQESEEIQKRLKLLGY